MPSPLQKRHNDRAISQACVRLRPNKPALRAFHQLLAVIHQRAPRLLEGGIHALVQLALQNRYFLRRIEHWPGTTDAWQPAVHKLATYLLCRYQTPEFLARAWYDQTLTDAAQWQHRFIEHGRGASFRSLSPPVPMTRQMEHRFLRSRPDQALPEANRRAELVALGISERRARNLSAWLTTRQLKDPEFWRSVWQWLARYEAFVSLDEACEIVRYIESKHEVEPSFSMKSRTPGSMFRLLHEWRREQNIAANAPHWAPSGIRPMRLLDDSGPEPVEWRFVELTSTSQLYAHWWRVVRHRRVCAGGYSSIWSLRLRNSASTESVLTVEIAPHSRKVLQIRGFAYRRPSGRARWLLAQWCEREGIELPPDL